MSKEQQQTGEARTDYVDGTEASPVSNRDAAGLGPMTFDDDLITGEDGRESPDFVPTIHELKELAFFWMSERVLLGFEWFVYKEVDSPDWQMGASSSHAA